MPKPPFDELFWRDEARPEDAARIRRIVEATGFFTPEEIAIAQELVEERIAKGPASGYEFSFREAGEALLGYACYGRTPGTDHSWDLYWIAVAPEAQGRGRGRQILDHIEPKIRAAGGKLLWAETSSTDRYAPTRAFYLRAGFREAARLNDFYRTGDSKVIYEKAL
jgi:ribosomal protein S18 acetylase RimI-like enzyme